VNWRILAGERVTLYGQKSSLIVLHCGFAAMISSRAGCRSPETPVSAPVTYFSLSPAQMIKDAMACNSIVRSSRLD
jgi:hypothetical protein